MSETDRTWLDDAAVRYLFPRRTPAAAWLAAPASLVLTLGLFLLLPLSELLAPNPSRGLELRRLEVSTVQVTPPPVHIPQPPPRPKERPETPRRALSAPKLEVPETWTKPSLRLPVSLSLSVPDLSGDFELDFAVVPQVAAPPPPAVELTPSVFDLGQLDRPPVALLQIPPVYPYQARARGIEGHVDLQLTVTPSGTAADITVLAAAPGNTFVENATKAVSRWRFEPGTKGGKAVATRIQVRLRFALK